MLCLLRTAPSRRLIANAAVRILPFAVYRSVQHSTKAPQPVTQPTEAVEYGDNDTRGSCTGSGSGSGNGSGGGSGHGNSAGSSDDDYESATITTMVP